MSCSSLLGTNISEGLKRISPDQFEQTCLPVNTIEIVYDSKYTIKNHTGSRENMVEQMKAAALHVDITLHNKPSLRSQVFSLCSQLTPGVYRVFQKPVCLPYCSNSTLPHSVK